MLTWSLYSIKKIGNVLARQIKHIDFDINENGQPTKVELQHRSRIKNWLFTPTDSEPKALLSVPVFSS